MVELQMDTDLKEVREVDVLLASEMIERHSGTIGTLCFAVRRPGTCCMLHLVSFNLANNKLVQKSLTPTLL
jgi:hypothetical protein